MDEHETLVAALRLLDRVLYEHNGLESKTVREIEEFLYEDNGLPRFPAIEIRG